MSVTDELVKLLPSLSVHNEGDWSKTVSEYSAFNDAGVECEVGEFFYGLVRMMKPNNILETGTHWGISSLYMAMALEANGKGMVDTHEFLPEIYKKAKANINDSGLSHRVNMHLGDVTKWTPSHQYQIALLDTEPQTRFQEFVRFFDYIDEGGIIIIHDLHRHMGQQPNEEHGYAWPWGEVPGHMRTAEQANQIRAVHFSTPRGVSMFYKVHPEDYRWRHDF